MKKTITKTVSEEIEIEVNYPMFVKDENHTITWFYALISDEKYIEVTKGDYVNGIKTMDLQVDNFIDLPQITEEEFLKEYAEANSVNVVNYHNVFSKQNDFIEAQAERSN